VADVALGADLTAEQIVDEVLKRNAWGFDDALARMSMVLTSSSGRNRTREIEVWSMQREGLGKTLVRFHAPADVAGTGFLVLENADRADDQYLYLPALGKVKRISGGQRKQRFMGTDLTYADLESRSLRDGKSTRLGDAKLGSNDTYVLETVLAKDSQYGKTITWVHKKSFVALKIEFYDRNLKLLKKLNVKRLEKRDGSWIAMESLIKNVQRKTQTLFSVSEVKTRIKHNPEIFTQSHLRDG